MNTLASGGGFGLALNLAFLRKALDLNDAARESVEAFDFSWVNFGASPHEKRRPAHAVD